MECRVCRVLKLDDEMKNKFSCIECFKMKRKRYRETHKEEKKNYKQTNKKRIAEQRKKYKQTHKEQIKKYNEINKEHISEQSKKYYEMHKEERKNYEKINKVRIAQVHKNYQQNNKEYLSEQKKIYSKKRFINCLLLHCKGKKIGFDIDETWVLFVLQSQNSKCFYCKLEIYEPMNEKWNKFLQISIDRKNSNIGYIKENCVLSCLFCNLSKNASTVEQFIDYLNLLKTGDSMNKYKDEKNIDWAYRLSNFMKVFTQKEKVPNEFSPEIIKQMFIKQSGLDYFTGLPMITSKIPHFPFKPSIDRIDNSKPHTLDNCVLVCLAGNYGRHVATVENYRQHILKLRQK